MKIIKTVQATKNSVTAESGSISTPIAEPGVAGRQPGDAEIEGMLAEVLDLHGAEEDDHAAQPGEEGRADRNACG